MKLYTEFEVKFAMDIARCQPNLTFDEVLEQITPIELPSDEDIDKAIFPYMDSLAKAGFIDGAKWMRDKILKK